MPHSTIPIVHATMLLVATTARRIAQVRDVTASMDLWQAIVMPGSSWAVNSVQWAKPIATRIGRGSMT
jgi:hypothetical protein